jgi:pectate lyase
VLVEGNVFRGDTPEALSTYGLVIPNDSPNTSPDGDYEIDGFANLGAGETRSYPICCGIRLIGKIENDFGTAGVNITQVGDFTEAPYAYTLTPLASVEEVVKASAGRGKIC